MAASFVVNTASTEPFYVEQPFNVYDSLPGKFLSWKTPMYNLYSCVYISCVSDMLQWLGELYFLFGMFNVARCRVKDVTIWWKDRIRCWSKRSKKHKHELDTHSKRGIIKSAIRYSHRRTDYKYNAKIKYSAVVDRYPEICHSCVTYSK